MGVGDGADDRQAEAGAAGVAGAGVVEPGEAVEDAARGPRGSRGRRRRRGTRTRSPRLLDAELDPAVRPVCSNALRIRLRSAWARRSGSASMTIGGDRARAPGGGRRSGAGRRTRPVRNRAGRSARRRRNRSSLGMGEESRSSTSRLMRSISARRAPGRGAISAGSGCSLSASTSSWPRMTVSGVRSSCDASATNAALARECVLEAVEHVVEGVREDPDLVAAAAELHPRREVAARRRAAATRAIRRSGRATAERDERSRRSAPASIARAPASRNAASTLRWARVDRLRAARRPRARDRGRRSTARLLTSSRTGRRRAASRRQKPGGRPEDRVGAAPPARRSAGVVVGGRWLELEQLGLVGDRLTAPRDRRTARASSAGTAGGRRSVRAPRGDRGRRAGDAARRRRERRHVARCRSWSVDLRAQPRAVPR